LLGDGSNRNEKSGEEIEMPFFLKIIASAFLLIYIFNPKIGWMISEGWKYKNAEPSEVYLIINRILAVAFLIIIWFLVR